MNTKKILVAYDESKPTSGQGDFLAVVFDGETPVFFGLRSRRIHKTGRMVFIGKDITEKEFFAKLVDSGQKIESVGRTLKNLGDYMQQLDGFKIGNVLGVVPKADEVGFSLFKVAEKPKTEAKQLP